MTDLEMTKLCATAMGYSLTKWRKGWIAECLIDKGVVHENYDPLLDDAQAHALIRKFNLNIGKVGHHPGWRITFREPAHDDYVMTMDDDLNRAIVMCVATRQARLSV